jgi:hypothetical protein
MVLDEGLHEKMIRLAESLLSGTKNGKVAWAPTDNEYTYLCTGTRSSVTVESFVDRDGDTQSTLSILNLDPPVECRVRRLLTFAFTSYFRACFPCR